MAQRSGDEGVHAVAEFQVIEFAAQKAAFVRQACCLGSSLHDLKSSLQLPRGSNSRVALGRSVKASCFEQSRKSQSPPLIQGGTHCVRRGGEKAMNKGVVASIAFALSIAALVWMVMSSGALAPRG